MTRDPLLKWLVSEYNKKKELKAPTKKIVNRIKERMKSILNFKK